MSTKTRDRRHLQVVAADPVDPAPCCDAERRRDLAVMKFEEGLRLYGVGLPTDGWDVARKMALILAGANDWRDDAEAPS